MNASRYIVGVVCCLVLAGCDLPALLNNGGTQAAVDDEAVPEAAADDEAAPEAGATRSTGRPAADPLKDVQFDGPTVISEGGTYSGNWQSTDPTVPAVKIATTEPVVIDNANIRSRGHLIQSETSGTDVTVRNTVGVGLNPGRTGATAGRFVYLLGARRATITGNDLVGTAGIIFGGYGGDGSPRDTFKVVRNRARNIEGRLSDGAGWSTDDDSAELTQFVQFSEVHGVPGIEVAWNDVLNEPGKSRAEDVISVYLSSGTPESPIRIHHNFIDGAYPTDPTSDGYSGGGIMLGDGRADPDGVSHVTATANHVVNTTNHGMAISAGEHVTIRNNRVLSTGRLPDGTAVVAQNVGIYVWNYHGQPAFRDNDAIDNVVGWEHAEQGERSDFWLPDVSRSSGNRAFPGTVTDDVIDEEYTRWRDRAATADVTVGASR